MHPAASVGAPRSARRLLRGLMWNCVPDVEPLQGEERCVRRQVDRGGLRRLVVAAREPRERLVLAAARPGRERAVPGLGQERASHGGRGLRIRERAERRSLAERGDAGAVERGPPARREGEETAGSILRERDPAAGVRKPADAPVGTNGAGAVAAYVSNQASDCAVVGAGTRRPASPRCDAVRPPGSSARAQESRAPPPAPRQ